MIGVELCLAVAFAASVSAQTNGGRDERGTPMAVPQRVSALAQIQNLAGHRAEQTRIDMTRQKLHKLQRQTERGKRIFQQLGEIARIDSGRAGAVRKNELSQSLTSQQMNRVLLLGQPTGFSRAPYVGTRVLPAKGGKMMTPYLSSAVLINGQQRDTVHVGESFDVTFSFSSGYVSAVMDVFVDVDNDGMVDSTDIPLMTSALLLDNGANDLDSRDGFYKYSVKKGDVLSRVAGSLLFRVNDYSSASTASVTITPRASVSIFTARISPAISGIVAKLNTQLGDIYGCTDSTGSFTTPIPLPPPYSLQVTLYDPTGKVSGYLMPQAKYIDVYTDTTAKTVELTSATAFIEGNVRDYDGHAVPYAIVNAHGDYDYYVTNDILIPPPYSFSAETRADSQGHYKIGLIGGRWSLYSRVDWTNEYLSACNQNIIVPSDGTILVDLALPKSNASISGRVRLDGSGIGGVSVCAYSGYLANCALSDRDGNYSIPVFRLGTYSASVSISDAGYSADTAYKYSLPPDTAGVDFSISKVKGGASGKIMNGVAGTPVRRAVITFSGPTSFTTMSDDSGNYRAPLRDGQYYVYIFANGYFGHTENALSISGQVVTRNYTLTPAAAITGRVIDTRGFPVAYANVALYANEWSGTAYSYTDEDGYYCLNELTPGDYRLRAYSSGYMMKWYNGKTDYSSADVIHVLQGRETSGIDFTLSRGGMISGRVGNRSGQPLGDAYVVVYDSLYYWSSYASTNDSGEYRVYGLYTGSYSLCASHLEYSTMWYDEKRSSETATPVHVVLDKETPNIDFALWKGATISGVVTNKKQGAISNAYISVFDTSLNFVSSGYTGYSGTYSIARIYPGSYYAMAWAYAYGQRWYDNVSCADSAAVLSLAENEVREGIDFVLPAGGIISGSVSDASGNPIAWAGVNAYSVDGSESRFASSANDGSYALAGLSAHQYFVEAYSGNFLPQWYDHKSSLANADTVRVMEDSTTTGIDFNLTNGWGISGYVLDDSTSLGLAGMCVEAINITDGFVLSVCTDANGFYQIPASPGSYILRAYSNQSPDYVMTYYSSQGEVGAPSKAEVIIVCDSGYPIQATMRVQIRKDHAIVNRSRISLVLTNDGRLGNGDSLLPSGRWPDSTSRNYIPEGNFIFGASSDLGTAVYGSLGGLQNPFNWIPLWNYNEHAGKSGQMTETFFSSGTDTTICHARLVVSQRLYSTNAADYVINTYKLHYDGNIFGANLSLRNVYLGEILRFSISNGKDMIRSIAADSLVFAYDSTHAGGINIGVRALGGSSPKIGWWKVSEDPENMTSLYHALENGSAISQSATASDYRLFVSSGPYTIYEGDSIAFAFAIVAGLGSDSLSSASRAAAREYGILISDVKPPDDPTLRIPSSFQLFQNYPNPFNPSTNIKFDLARMSRVRLEVYNVLGQRIEEWNFGTMQAGRYERTLKMDRHPSGLYFYSITAVASDGERFTSVRKMVLVK